MVLLSCPQLGTMGVANDKNILFSRIFNAFNMTHRNTFRGQNDFLRLQEAIEQLMENDDIDAEYDILVEPPDTAFISDEDEGNEDDLLCINMPNDVPEKIELVSRNENGYWLVN